MTRLVNFVEDGDDILSISLEMAGGCCDKCAITTLVGFEAELLRDASSHGLYIFSEFDIVSIFRGDLSEELECETYAKEIIAII